MRVKSEQLFTHVVPAGVAGKIVQFPLVRVVIAFMFFLPLTLLVFFFDYVHDAVSGEWLLTLVEYIKSTVGFAVMILLWRLYCRVIERRTALEFSTKGLLKELGLGLGIGAGLQLVMAAVLALLGYLHLEGYNLNVVLLTDGLFSLATAALIEEVMFRAILFKMTEELFGSWIAITIQAFLFGFAHLGNPNATVMASIAIMLSAGFLLAGTYMFTRRIWLVLGIHFAWNWVQGPVLGLPISGAPSEGILTPVVNGPEWLTGGAFGVEASVMTPILCCILGIIFLRKALLNQQLVRPMWVRKRESENKAHRPTDIQSQT